MAGGDPWGGGPWGGSDEGGEGDPSPEETLTLVEGLSVAINFELIAAVPLSLTLVELTFSHPLDSGYAFHTNPTNYAISPVLGVLGVAYTAHPRKLRINTDFQAPVVYTLTVGTARSVDTDLIDPNSDTVQFVGFGASPTFFATAQGPRKVMLTFSQPMLQDSEFVDPTSYVIQDLNGNVIPVTAATPQGNAPISRVTLTLGADLVDWVHYVAQVGVTVKTTTGINVSPDSDVFQWENMRGVVSRGPLIIPFDAFSGEVSGGLHGTPDGQVFFSPALEASAANSTIEVEEVSVCSTAFDSYRLPDIPDPNPFFVFGGGLPSITNGPNVLWAPADRLGLARVELHDTRADSFSSSADALMAVILREPIDITIGGFLNDTRWHVYDGTPTTFTVADNLSPVGIGPTITVLYPTDNITIPESVVTISSYVRPVVDVMSAVDSVSIAVERTVNDTLLVTDTLEVNGMVLGEFDLDEFEGGDFD